MSLKKENLAHDSKRLTRAGRILLGIMTSLIGGYQKILSPMLHALTGHPCACRFHPTCSEYAKQAMQTHGIVQGILLAISRVMRCHPLNPGGFDPIPPKTIIKHKIEG